MCSLYIYLSIATIRYYQNHYNIVSFGARGLALSMLDTAVIASKTISDSLTTLAHVVNDYCMAQYIF